MDHSDLYFILFKTINIDMRTEKIVNNLINENIFSFKINALRYGG